MSILNRFDPVFTECLGCLCPPPYPFAICVAQTIDEATIKAKALADRLYKMTFKEQLATDLQAIMAADEVSEDITYTPRKGTPLNIKAVISIDGDSNLEFANGKELRATAVIAKADLLFVPRTNDSFTDSSNREWKIIEVASENFVSWRFSVVSEVRIK